MEENTHRLRRRIVTGMAAGLILPSAARSQTQGGLPPGWPSKPIRMIIPYGTGGATDSLGRMLAAKMSEQLGQPVVVENRPGANGGIGTGDLARSAPDGYTFCMISSSHVVNPYVTTGLTYNTRTDFAPVTMLTRISSVLVVHPSVPATNVQELVALIRQNPDRYFYGIAGGLSNGHVMMERFKQEAGLKVTGVMFKGAGPAAVELVAGRVHMMIVAPPGVKSFVEAGRLNVLASTGSRNPPGFPNLPSMVESGFPQLVSHEWLGFITRAGTPRPVIDRVNHIIAQALRDPATTRMLNGQSQDVVANPPDEFGAFIDRELDRFSELSKTLNLKDS
jgi:tripartite-type tricarboxylate transporter receptor subunit TctC